MSFWNDPLKVAADWLMGIFTGWGMPEIAAQILIGFLGILLLISLLMVLDIFLVWVERKVVSRFQDRIGPNRVGPFGLIQPFADIIKLLIKEDITPGGADKVVYNIAPMLSMMSVLILWAVVPLAPRIIGVDLNIGALYIIAAGAIGTLSIIMAGWSSNNKFALIGAFRQVAVMVSFEIPMLTMLLIPTIFAGFDGIQRHHRSAGYLVRVAGSASSIDLPHRRDCRAGTRSLRYGGRRIRAGGGLQHGIFRDEVRHVLCRRAPACLYIWRLLGDPVLWRVSLLWAGAGQRRSWRLP